MPGPAVFVASAVGGAAIGATVAPFFSPLSRGVTYITNYQFPNVVLTPPDAIALYHRDIIGFRSLDWHLKQHGVEIYNNATGQPDNWQAHAWRFHIENTRPTMSVEAALDALNRGVISRDDMERVFLRHGVMHEDDRRAVLTAETPVSVERTRANYNSGKWDRTLADLELRAAGYGRDGDWSRVMDVGIPPPETVATQMMYRGAIDDAQYRQSLLHAGYHSREIQDAFISTVRPIPGPADLVRFAIREVWDQPTVDRFGYDEEFPPQLNHWLRKQGLAWGELMPGEPLPAGGVVTWPRAYWRAHWQPISPQQAYDAFHRLRPDRIGRYGGEIAGLTPFTFADLQTILKVADYPKASRPWLAALAFLPLRLIEIRNAYVHGSKDRQWAIDQLRDRGHSLPDANDIVDIWDGNEKYRRGAWIRSLEERQGQAVYREVLAGYEAGWIDHHAAYQRLTGMLVRPETAQTSLDLVDSKKARNYLKEVLRALRKDFLDGSISTVEAIAYLRQAQVPDSESARLVQRWSFLNTLKRRVATASQILQWTRDGLLPASLAVVRLRNLGWQEPDVALALARVRQQSARSTALALTARDRQRAAARRQLAQAAKQARAAQRSSESQLRTLYPLPDLKKWYLSGWRSRDWIVAMLRSQGRKDDWIGLKLTEWGEPKPAKTNGQAQAPAP